MELTDRELRERLIADPEQGWRAFIDQFTPVLLRAIHSQVRDRDDIMEIYTLTCEHLAANDCARLRRHDPAKGTLAAWLATVARRVLIDWVRSVRGRQRLFKSIAGLSQVDQSVFEQYYWRRQTLAEIAERVTEHGQSIGVPAVFDSIERIERALTPRQRTDLLAMSARKADPIALDGEPGRALEVPAEGPDAEELLHASRRADELAAAMAELPVEDRLIVTMRYVDGLTVAQIQRALHLEQLTVDRVSSIMSSLRESLLRRGPDGGRPASSLTGGRT